MKSGLSSKQQNSSQQARMNIWGIFEIMKHRGTSWTINILESPSTQTDVGTIRREMYLRLFSASEHARSLINGIRLLIDLIGRLINGIFQVICSIDR